MGMLTKMLDKGMQEDIIKYTKLLKDVDFIADKVICNIYSHTVFAVNIEEQKWCTFEDKEYGVKLEKHSRLKIKEHSFWKTVWI